MVRDLPMTLLLLYHDAPELSTRSAVAMTGKGLVFDSSLDKGKPYDIRVGTGQVCHPAGPCACRSALSVRH